MCGEFRRKRVPHDCLHRDIRFLYSQNWDDVAKATRRSLKDSTTDEMIQLVHSSRATEVSHQPPLYGVRRLTYEATERLLIVIDAVNRDEDEHVAVDEADEELASVEPQAPELDEEPGMPSEIPKVEAVVYDEEHHAAATFCQRRWRMKKSLREREISCRKLRSDLFQGTFQSCLTQAPNIASSRSYVKYFLGPLPHILLCLNIVTKRAHDLKKQSRKQRLQDNQDYLLLEDKLMRNTSVLPYDFYN
jgi:hypothetical protein